jgi:predicted nucleic acid-binding protein
VPAVVFDANFLTLLLHPTARAPQDPTTGKAVEHASRRIEMLVDQLSKDGVRIVIPTPVLSEFLVIAGDSASEYVRVLDKSARFEIAAFDQRAAIENAAALLNAIKQGDKRSGLDKAPWQKIKIDRQIVAIAKVRGATVLYSTDHDIATLARESDLQVRHIADLPMPDEGLPLLRGLGDDES